MNEPRVKVIACATVLEEMIPLMPPGMTYQELDFGLHHSPDGLRQQLQKAIDESASECDVVILGYGLCSLAVVGLRATSCTLVVPKVDDCIAIFLGSSSAYQDQFRAVPGTYYLTKGWIEGAVTPFDEYETLVERYGKEDADELMTMLLGNYRRLAFIDTGTVDQDRYRAYARETAERFGLRYEEIPGSNELIKKMVHGPWEDDFVVAPPGTEITFDDFNRKTPA